MSQTPSDKTKVIWPRSILLTVALFVVGIVIGASAVYYFIHSAQPKSEPQPVTPIVTPEPVTSTVPETTPATSTTPVNYVTDDRALNLTIDWQTPKNQNASEIFAAGSNAYQNFTAAHQTDTYLYLEEDGWWLRGTVKSGDLKGYKLYRATMMEDAIGGGVTVFPMLVSPDRAQCLLLVDPQGFSPDQLALFKDACTYAPKMILANLNDPPSTVTIAGKGDIYQVRRITVYGYDFGACTPTSCSATDLSFENMGKTSDGRTVFTGNGETFGASEYLSLFNAYGEQFMYTQIKSRLTAQGYDAKADEPVTWDAAYQNLKNFNYNVPSGGCGAAPDLLFLATSTPGLTAKDLVKAGVTASGKTVYVPKDPANNAEVISVYDMWMSYDLEGGKPSIGEFFKQYPQPVYFRQDMFGRWVKFQITEVQPVAECGKPVIYLYPTKATEVAVKLPNFIKVTVSEPMYPAKGWTVMAQPDGTLKYADGQEYGSLFWEGIGVNYQAPAEGFLVKDGEVDAFLTRILAQYGLNERESAEFREFWVPRMTGAPYYRVSFLTDAWSQAAPLQVTPKPDTSIRLFMDWHKLNAPIQITEPKIVTPVRQGFTLVEWGGILWK